MSYREAVERCPDKRVAAALTAAIASLLERDAYLLQVDCHERTLAHRLAVYLEGQFDNYSVDLEYSRLGEVPKRLDGRGFDRVLPDIVVHRRGHRDNLLVVEIKKSSSRLGYQDDREKLAAFKEDQRFCYQHALFLVVGVGADSGSFQCEWI